MMQANRPCEVEGCHRLARSRSAAWCETHYHRHYRTQSLDAVVPKHWYRQSAGYLMVHRPGHLFANKDGWAYEHRVVAYERCGGVAPERCEWCERPLDGWTDAHIDHIDCDRANNASENLKVSCRACNIGRRRNTDIEGWARAVAAHRILNRHAAEYDREVVAIREHFSDLGQPATIKARQTQMWRALSRSRRA